MTIYLISFPILNNRSNPLNKSFRCLAGSGFDIKFYLSDLFFKFGNKISIFNSKYFRRFHFHK